MQLECGKYGKFYPMDGLSGAALGAHSPDDGVINPESIEVAMGYGAFRGLEPDSAEQKNEKPIYPMCRLQNFCRYYHVRIGIITVPAENAQAVCDLLVSCGVSAIWNFAPVHLQVPDHVIVQSENLAVSLTALRIQMRKQKTA